MKVRLWSMSLFALMSCEILDEAVDADALAECPEVCAKVDECSATPPTPEFGSLSGSSGIDALDCSANCVQTDRVFYGYSDCQMDCIIGEKCGAVDDCWKTKSDVYKKYCLAGRDVPPAKPGPDDVKPDNGTESGNEQADEILDDPANEIAIDEGDFDIHYGDDPPDITGLYHAVGSIDEASNARPTGSRIDTRLCYWGQEKLSKGAEVNYCEHYVPGTAAAPVTGSGDDFTIYLEYPGQATLLFSGTVGSDGKVTEAETLVVYLHGVDIWEHSNTSWTHEGTCDSCP